MLTFIQSSFDNSNMYRCRTCNKELKTRSGWIKHELAHSSSFKCETCGKQYRRLSSLRQHQQKSRHGNGRCPSNIFTCSTCNGKFSTVRSLRHHHDAVHGQIGGASESALNGTAETKTLRPVGNDKFDLVSFLASARGAVEKYLLAKARRHAIKWYIVAQVELSRETAEGEVRTVEPFFRSITNTLLTPDNFESHDLNAALQKIVIGLEKYIHESSGWILQSVRLLNIHTVSYKPLNGSSFIELPTTLKQCGAILNIKNNDNKCFLWSILGHFYSALVQPENVEHYIP